MLHDYNYPLNIICRKPVNAGQDTANILRCLTASVYNRWTGAVVSTEGEVASVCGRVKRQRPAAGWLRQLLTLDTQGVENMSRLVVVVVVVVLINLCQESDKQFLRQFRHFPSHTPKQICVFQSSCDLIK